MFFISFFAYIVAQVGQLLIMAMSALMMIRALVSLLAPMAEGSLIDFLYTATEVVIYPVRSLCDRFGWFQSMPFDIPFMLTYIVLMLISALLPPVRLL